MAESIYLLCAAASLVGAWLLLRQYAVSRTVLLLWSCVAFLGLVLNNVLLFVDFALLPNTDLALFRTLAGTIGMLALVYGLIWEAER
jgi:hypothetical protein